MCSDHRSMYRLLNNLPIFICTKKECLRADRASAYHATFASRSLEQSLEHEANEGLGIISRESIAGAKKFVSGLGKHGKFNVTPVAEQQEWQIEFEELKKQELSKKKDN